MGKSKPPPAPDYTAAAKETAAGNLEAAKYAVNANRINQVTPYGSLSYTYQPQYDASGKETGGGWTQTETLTPEAQAALNQQLALNQKYGEVANIGFDKARNLFENPQLDTSGLPQGATGIDLSKMPQGGQQMAMPGQAQQFSAAGLPEAGAVGSGLPQLTQQSTGNLPGMTGVDRSGLPQSVTGGIKANAAGVNPNGLPSISGGINTAFLPQAVTGGISANGATVDLGALPGRGVGQGETAMRAIMSRLQPQLQQQEDALRTRLANQGIGLGSEAYQREQMMQGQRANDLQLQAAAQGISVDEMVRQNAFQEQMGAANVANQGAQMSLQAQMANANLANQARQQMFGERVAQAGLTRQDRQQLFGEQLSQANVANQGAQMDMQAQLANAGLANQARQQHFSEQMGAGSLGQSQREQLFREQMGMAGLDRSDRQQLFGEQMAQAGLTQAQREQMFNEQLSGFGANQQAQAQQFMQGLQANQFNQGLQNQYLQNQMNAQGFNQNLRQQGLAEQAYLQDRPLNLINALRSGNQVNSPQFQQFAQQATTQGPDILGAQQAQYQAAVAANNANNANKAAMWGGITSMLGNAASLGTAQGGTVGGNYLSGLFSDRRLKTDIRKVGKLDNGLNVYSYRYIWGGPTHIGVMAQEVEKVNPGAVFEVDGFKAVNYAGL